MNAFRDALQVLIPIAERIHMPWKEPNSYDDWDSICSAIFCSVVTRSVESATEGKGFLPILPYDKRVSSYSDKSYIAHLSEQGPAAFVCLQTKEQPFDVCLLANLDKNQNVFDYYIIDFEKVEFVFVGNKANSSVIFSELEVVL